MDYCKIFLLLHWVGKEKLSAVVEQLLMRQVGTFDYFLTTYEISGVCWLCVFCHCVLVMSLALGLMDLFLALKWCLYFNRVLRSVQLTKFQLVLQSGRVHLCFDKLVQSITDIALLLLATPSTNTITSLIKANWVTVLHYASSICLDRTLIFLSIRAYNST